MISRRTVLSSLLLLVLIGAGPTSWAQFTSSIEGTVTDASGAVIAGAAVTLKNEETGVTQTVQTQDSGYYRFPTLSSAVFTVSASAQGFQTTVQQHIRVEVASTKTVNLRLLVGGTSSVVNVTSEAAAIETSEGRVSGEIQESKIHDLPLSGRNFYTLVVTTPGVTGIASSGGQAYAQASGDIFNPEFGINLNANGSRAESNTFLIDSNSIDSTQRDGVTNVNPNAEDVQEVRVAANQYSAEFGRNGAALVNIITKQGTNNWHGTVGFYHTDNKLQARNEFQTAVPVFRRNEGAWSLGGPVRKNHTFFFLSMDILRSGVAFSEAATVLTPQFIDLVNTNVPNNVSNQVLQNYVLPAYASAGASGGLNPNSGFVNAGTIAQSNCTGSTVIMPDNFPIPCDFPVTGVANFSATNPRNGFQYTARIDHSFNGDKDRIFLEGDHTDLHQVAFGEPFVYPAFNTIEPTYSEHFAADWVHVGGSWVNEFGFSTQRPYGNLSVNDPQVPGIAIAGLSPGGNNAETFQQGWGPNAFVQNNFEWRDVASLTRGSHSLKIGGNVTRGRADHESSRVFDRPDFTFNNIFDFATDTATAETGIGFNPVTGAVGEPLYSLMRTGSLSAFVQDDWKLRPNLTLNLGFRYEDFFNPSDATGEVCEMSFPNGSSDLRSMISSGVMTCGKHMFNHTLNTFSPRIGFAWDPTHQGKMSVRGGIGIFYDRPSDQLDNNYYTNTPRFAVGGAFSNTPNNLPLFALGTTSTPPYNYPLPPGLVPATLPDLNAQGGLLSGSASVQVVDPGMPVSYMQNWFLGVQREMTPSIVAEIDYIGSVGRHLYATYNVNRFDGDLIQNSGSFTGLVPGFSSINYGQANENSSYNGLTFAVKKRAGAGLTFDASYTYSKAIDDSSRLDGPEHVEAFNDSRERGLADFDVRHRVAFTTLWSVPSPHGSGVLNKVLGNWELTNVTILQSGPPFSVICTASFPGCDYNADGTNLDYPNTPTFGNTKTGLSRSDYIQGIFDCSGSPNCSSVFPTPALGQEGNLGRNTFHGPGYANTDFSVIKNIAIPWFLGTEGSKLQFRAEFFNVFNRVNLTNVNNQVNGAAFGRSTSTYPARDIQFALRFSF